MSDGLAIPSTILLCCLASVGLSEPVNAQEVSSGTSWKLDRYRLSYRYSLPGRRSPHDIVGIGIKSNDRIVAWYRDGNFSRGTTRNLERYSQPGPYTAVDDRRITAMAMNCQDKVFAWYDDRTYSEGSVSDLGIPDNSKTYKLPDGRGPSDIMGMGIAKNGHVYAWYRDGWVSSGTVEDLSHHRKPYRYTTATLKGYGDLVDLGIACSNDHVYAWYLR